MSGVIGVRLEALEDPSTPTPWPGALLDGPPPPTSLTVHDEGLVLASVQLLLADYLASIEEDVERRAKMAGVMRRILESIEAAHHNPVDPAEVVAAAARLDREERVAVLVEAAFLDPFHPYTLRYRKADARRALDRLADWWQLEPDFAGRIADTISDAKRAYRTTSWTRVGIVGLGAGIALGVGGWMAAPLIGGVLGAGAGLSGAVAVGHGLALLGGGSLAAGGAGMAGGMWLIAGASAAAGTVSAGGGYALYQLGAKHARQELLKLQVTFKLALIDAQADTVKAQAAITDLRRRADELEELLIEERELNEKNAERIRDVEQTLESVERALAWMEETKEAVGA